MKKDAKAGLRQLIRMYDDNCLINLSCKNAIKDINRLTKELNKIKKEMHNQLEAMSVLDYKRKAERRSNRELYEENKKLKKTINELKNKA